MRNPTVCRGGGTLEAFACGEFALTVLDFGKLDTTELVAGSRTETDNL